MASKSNNQGIDAAGRILAKPTLETISTPAQLLNAIRDIHQACGRANAARNAQSITRRLNSLCSVVRKTPDLVSLGSLSLVLNMLKMESMAAEASGIMACGILKTARVMSEAAPTIIQANAVLKDLLQGALMIPKGACATHITVGSEARDLFRTWSNLGTIKVAAVVSPSVTCEYMEAEGVKVRLSSGHGPKTPRRMCLSARRGSNNHDL